MQRFVAELSSAIDKDAFERSWQNDPTLNHSQPKVEFQFAGRIVSITVHSEPEDRWPPASFHQSFSAAIRRLNQVCNVRWL